MKALFLTAHHFEDMELFVPLYRLKEEEIEVDIASIEKGLSIGIRGYEIECNLPFNEVRQEEYGILVLPGGRAPEIVRNEKRALKIAQYFMEHHKPVAAICHGPQILISANVISGRHATCYDSIVSELKNAGGIYENQEVVVDGNLVTSRKPSDLPSFLREMMKLVRSARH